VTEAKNLEDYAGEFHSADVGASYWLVAEEGRLSVRVNDIVLGMLQPAQGKDRFDLKGVSFVFTREPGGKIDGFDFATEEIEGLRFERRVDGR